VNAPLWFEFYLKREHLRQRRISFNEMMLQGGEHVRNGRSNHGHGKIVVGGTFRFPQPLGLDDCGKEKPVKHIECTAIGGGYKISTRHNCHQQAVGSPLHDNRCTSLKRCQMGLGWGRLGDAPTQSEYQRKGQKCTDACVDVGAAIIPSTRVGQRGPLQAKAKQFTLLP